MPYAPKRPCNAAGCRELTNDRYCDKHAVDKAATQQYDFWRGSPKDRGYDSNWKRVRKQALRRDCFLCQCCLKQGRVTPATEVHHVVPISVDPTRRLDLTNLLSLCHSCHMTAEDQARKLYSIIR